MKKRAVPLIIIVLALITAVLTVINLNSGENVAPGTLRINGRVTEISGLELTAVQGTVVNAKGQERQIDAQGVCLSELLAGTKGTATVTAVDNFGAQVQENEREQSFLLMEEDGSLRLVVFGDTDSKRAVKNVVRIDTN